MFYVRNVSLFNICGKSEGKIWFVVTSHDACISINNFKTKCKKFSVLRKKKTLIQVPRQDVCMQPTHPEGNVFSFKSGSSFSCCLRDFPPSPLACSFYIFSSFNLLSNNVSLLLEVPCKKN